MSHQWMVVQFPVCETEGTLGKEILLHDPGQPTLNAFLAQDKCVLEARRSGFLFHLLSSGHGHSHEYLNTKFKF